MNKGKISFENESESFIESSKKKRSHLSFLNLKPLQDKIESLESENQRLEAENESLRDELKTAYENTRYVAGIGDGLGKVNLDVLTENAKLRDEMKAILAELKSKVCGCESGFGDVEDVVKLEDILEVFKAHSVGEEK